MAEECVHCGKSGKKICDSCLEKIANGKLNFIFPIKRFEGMSEFDAFRSTPTKIIIPMEEAKTTRAVGEANNEPQKINVLKTKSEAEITAADTKSQTDFSNAIVKDIDLLTEEQEIKKTNTRQTISINKTDSESQNNIVLQTQDEVPQGTADIQSKGSSPKVTVEDIISLIEKQESRKTTKSGGNLGWWIVTSVIIGIIVASILLPWDVGQWIVGISIGLIVIGGFLIFAFDAYFDDDFTILDIVLFILSGTNIGLMLWIKSSYSTIAFVVAIALSISSFVVMGRAYFEAESKQGHWALFFMLVNIASFFMDKIMGYVAQLFSGLMR